MRRTLIFDKKKQVFFSVYMFIIELCQSWRFYEFYIIIMINILCLKPPILHITIYQMTQTSIVVR